MTGSSNLPPIGRTLDLLPPEPRQSKFDRLFQEHQAIEADDAWRVGKVGFISSVMVQATLPYREPKGSPLVWGRRAGTKSLFIQPGASLREVTTISKSGRKITKTESVSLGFPFGSRPRLLLAWLGREVKRTKSPEIELGSSITHFMSEIGLDQATGGVRGSMTLLREQMKRLFSARIMFSDQSPDSLDIQHFNSTSMQIADDMQLWWSPRDPDQLGLFNSTVRLSDRFFQEIVEHGVPLDMRALKALKQSPFELDLYSWLTYRFFTLSKRTLVPWHALKDQFGSEITGMPQFRFKLRKALDSVLVVFPDAKLDPDNPEGLVLLPSNTSVRRVTKP